MNHDGGEGHEGGTLWGGGGVINKSATGEVKAAEPNEGILKTRERPEVEIEKSNKKGREGIKLRKVTRFK